MEDTIVSVRVKRKTFEEMRKREDINWSAIIRKSINQYLEGNEDFDRERAIKASKSMDKIRKSRKFDEGKKGTQIIREWREKRK